MKVLLLLLAKMYIQWHASGHMLTAYIAYQQIQQHPNVQARIDQILQKMVPFTKEKDYPFIEAAEWADDIKYLNWRSFNSWHFNDNYFSDDNTPINIPKADTNIVWAIY